MVRAFAAGLLLSVAALAAGCGSAGLQASADQLGSTWGDPHPTIVRSEAVPLATGTEADVMQLHGHFRFSPSCIGGPVSRHGHRKCPGVVHLDTLVGAVNAHNHQLIEVGNDNTAAELEAFAQARDARPMFRIFPEFSDPLVQCRIPGYGGRTITGTCTTRVADGRRHGGAIAVALLEHWPLNGSKNRPYSGGWIVTITPSGHVVSIRRTGDLPPQLWTSSTPPPVPPLSVQRARRQLGYLRIFPSLPRTVACSIPAGGPRSPAPRTFQGTCTTKLLPRDGNRPVLEFVERWQEHGRTLTGGWVVTLRHDGRVLTVRTTGSNPPQSRR